MLKNTLLFAIVLEIIIASKVNEADEKIQELEKEKNDLFKQINQAIDASMRSLQKSNGTDALKGLQYMNELKEHFIKVNETAADGNYHREINNLDFAYRRKSKKNKNKNDPFDFESILKPKKIPAKEWKEIMDDREKMQKQLNEWIAKREKEKARLEQYKIYKKGMVKSGRYEKCPRFGYQGKKKKGVKDRVKIKHCREKITDSDFEEDYKKCIGLTKRSSTTTSQYDYPTTDGKMKRKSRKKKYPCCRKCCKKSYMGCL